MIAQKRDIGRIVTVNSPPGKVRLHAVVNPPCLAPIATQDLKTGGINPPRAVVRGVDAGHALPRRARDADPAVPRRPERAAGADRRGAGATRRRSRRCPPGKVTDITLKVPKGTQQWQAGFDWQGAPPAVPALTSVLLKQNGTSTELLY